jgi:hypothetical protein
MSIPAVTATVRRRREVRFIEDEESETRKQGLRTAVKGIFGMIESS